MCRPRFYCPGIATGVIELPPEEAHHARSALRMRAGQDVLLFDGAGTEAEARLTTVSKRSVSAEVGPIRHVPFDAAVRLTLAVALPKTHRQHFLFEKCTELGVDAIWPTICERSVVRPKPTSVGKWSRIAIEAAKQSRRAWLPRIEPPQSLTGTAAQAYAFDVAVALDAQPGAPALSDLVARHRSCGTMIAWVGPEGGLTAQEVDTLVAAGAQVARLGPSILRVETAALAVAAIVATQTDASDPGA